jgi:hypothetical protein
MAAVKQTANGKEYYQFSTTENLNLRAAFSGVVSSFMFTLVKTGGGTFSADLKGAAGGYDLAVANTAAIPYQRLSEATIDIASGTAVSNAGNYIVRADGMDVWFNLTAISAGTLEMYITPLLG